MRVDRSLGNDDDVSLLDGVALVVKSPGVPRETRSSPPPACPSGARSSSAAGCSRPARRRHRHERQDHDERAPRRDARRPVEVAGNVGRALTELDGEVADGELVVVELSSFQLEDVDELRCAAAILLNLEPGPPRPPRLVRGLPRREAADLREPGPRGHGRRAARVPAGARRGAAGRVRRGRSAAGRAAPPRRRTTARTPPPRPPPRAPLGVRDERDRRGAADVRGRRAPARGGRATVDGVRYVNDSKATNVGAALRGARRDRRADRPHPRRSRKGETFAPLAEAAAGRVQAARS